MSAIVKSEDAVSTLVSSSVMPQVNRFINNCDFKFLDMVSDSGSISAEFIRERIYFIFKEGLDSGKDSIIFNSVWNILRYNIIDSYLKEIFISEGEIFRKLKDELPQNFTLKDTINLFKTIVIIRPSLYPEVKSADNLPFKDGERRMIAERVESRFRPVPWRIIDEALKSFSPAVKSEDSGAIAGLIYIFDYLCRITPWHGDITAGSLSPHKSWFSLALINAEYFGFDTEILEELYSIAGERNW